jgi:hypothetical protein
MFSLIPDEPLCRRDPGAWRDNPNGTYVDWNPRVSCDGASND